MTTLHLQPRCHGFSQWWRGTL